MRAEDFPSIFDLVMNDVARALEDVVAPDAELAGNTFEIANDFTWTSGLEEHQSNTPIANYNSDGVATAMTVIWQWRGRHVGGLLGVSPRIGDPVHLSITGLTLVQEAELSETNDTGYVLHRFVDWLPVLKDLGARTFNRPVVDVRQHFGDAMLDIPEFRVMVEENFG